MIFRFKEIFMRAKKGFVWLLVVLLLTNGLSVGASAIRDGQTVYGFVEFTALGPNDLTASVLVELTDVENGYKLSYQLDMINGYFLNEAVPVGTYSVSVRVLGAEDGAFHLMYDNEVVVRENTVAASLMIIIDHASGGADAGDFIEPDPMGTVPEASNPDGTDPTSPDGPVEGTQGADGEDDTSGGGNEDPDDKRASNIGSVLVSFGISVLVLAVGAVGFWYFFKSRES